MPELQTLFEFLLMLCPKLIKGSLSFIQLGQEPRKEEGTCAGWSDRGGSRGGGLSLPAAFLTPLPPLSGALKHRFRREGFLQGPLT